MNYFKKKDRLCIQLEARDLENIQNQPWVEIPINQAPATISAMVDAETMPALEQLGALLSWAASHARDSVEIAGGEKLNEMLQGLKLRTIRLGGK